ncbi:MAG: peptidoglycan editing factor PgeF [Alphaproteobacteria bacterium]|nr:peptidoglycan editing factor PgeF [Alphaproteobacteria bacterium]
MLTHPTLERLPHVVHAFFTREGGTSDGIYASLNCGPGSNDAPARVAENRRRAMARLGLEPASLATVHQVHGRDVLRVEAPVPAGEGRQADGLVTNRPGIAIGILTADCAPVLLADPEARVIGAAHAGWRGAAAGVVEAVVGEMANLGARPARIHAVIGPCIGAESYEVGPEFPAPFLAADPTHDRFFKQAKAGRFRFDLAGYVGARLAGLGLGSIASVQADTCADATRFFSYRRAVLAGEPDYGRALSAIALKEA